MGIGVYYEEKPAAEEHGTNAIEGNNDFPSKKDLKKAVKAYFKNYQCPNCSGHRVDGENVVVEIGKVKFFREKLKKGFFGSKYVEKHFKDVWRIHNVFLKPSGAIALLNPAGWLACRSCKWKEKGGKRVRWLSLNDIRRGNF